MIDWKEKYMRDVEGLNNEGDPIGGDSPSGLRAALEASQKENNSLKLGCKAKEAILQEVQKEVAKLRSFDADNKGLKECNAILTAENAEQAKRIAELEESAKYVDEVLSSTVKLAEKRRLQVVEKTERIAELEAKNLDFRDRIKKLEAEQKYQDNMGKAKF